MNEPKIVPNREDTEVPSGKCLHMFEGDCLGLTGRCICGAHMNLRTHEVTEAPAMLKFYGGPDDGRWDPFKRADDITLVAGGTGRIKITPDPGDPGEVEKKVWSALAKVHAELGRSTEEHGWFNSKHEGYAVIKEQLDDLWDGIKSKMWTDQERYNEAMQVAAMAIKYMVCFKPDGR